MPGAIRRVSPVQRTPANGHRRLRTDPDHAGAFLIEPAVSAIGDRLRIRPASKTTPESSLCSNRVSKRCA
jgi:hypothetical protein